ncbi:MAG: hypothetical protein HY460_01565, partial [Parcubacteria group bacterium]|nr:hypothetical protein [Parcubacteria group bacterium]
LDLAMLVAVVLARAGDVRRRRSLSHRHLIWGVLSILVILSAFIGNTLWTPDLIRMFSAEDLSQVAPNLADIRDQFSYSPSHIAADAVFALEQGKNGEAFTSFALLLVFTAVALGVLAVLARWYLPLWQLFSEAHARTSRLHKSRIMETHSPLRTFFAKEWITFFRDGHALLWLGFLTILWLMQTGLFLIARKTLLHADISATQLSAMLPLQLMVGIYFVSALVLRFAFPSFSTEGKMSWMLASAPMDLAHLSRAKIFFFSGIFGVIALGMEALNGGIVTMPASQSAWFLADLVVATVLLTTYGIFLGTKYPNFETDDPQLLSTSLPGLAFVGGALITGGVLATLIVVTAARGIALPSVPFLVLAGIGILFFSRQTEHAARELEFSVHQ